MAGATLESMKVALAGGGSNARMGVATFPCLEEGLPQTLLAHLIRRDLTLGTRSQLEGDSHPGQA